jgi:hypothetical protein
VRGLPVGRDCGGRVVATVKTASCGCTVPVIMGKKTPERCEEHGKLFLGKSLGYDVTGLPSGGTTVMVERPRRRSKPLKRTRRKETKAERAARDNFNDKVKFKACWFRWHRPCERCDGTGWMRQFGLLPGEPDEAVRCRVCDGDGKHHCEGRKDAHHLIPKQFIRKRFQGVLPEDRLVAILFNPKIGAPLCRKAHDRIESGADRIYWSDLTDECIEYVGSLPDFVLLRLEEESPKRSAA